MDIQRLFDSGMATCPTRKPNGDLNDGTFFEIEISIYPWIEEHHKVPSKKELIGQNVEVFSEDLDNYDMVYYIGTISDFKFVNEKKKSIRVFLKECRRK